MYFSTVRPMVYGTEYKTFNFFIIYYEMLDNDITNAKVTTNFGQIN